MEQNDGNANDLTDYVLKKFPKHTIDPLPINLNTETVKIHEGELRGLSSVKRYGNCSFHTDDEGTKIVLELEASQLSSYFKYQINTGLGVIRGKLSTVINQVALKVDVSLVGNKIQLNSFQVLKLRGLKIVQLTGITKPFSWLLKFLANVILDALKGYIIRKLEDGGKDIVQQIVNQIPISKLSKL